MGNMTPSERASAPRPLFYALPRAIAAFIEHKCDRTRMMVPAWAATFHCGAEDVRSEWERQMSVISQQPTNIGEIPEGK